MSEENEALVRAAYVALGAFNTRVHVLPTAKGVRLLGVTVSNFDQVPISAANELPLFDAGEATVPQPDATSSATPTGMP